MGRVDVQDVPGLAKDTVSATSPEAGNSVKRGSQVNLVVASGDVVLTDVRGMKIDEAENLLTNDLRIQSISITDVETDQSEPGTVLSMNPAAGKVPYNQRVELVIAKAPTATPTEQPTQAPSTGPSNGPTPTDSAPNNNSDK